MPTTLPTPTLPHPVASDPLWRRPILIGTAATLPGLWEQVAALGLEPAGYLIADGQNLGDDGAGNLGSLDAVPTLHALEPFSAAIISLPASAGALMGRIRACLRACAIPERLIPTLADQLGAAPRGGTGGDIDIVELIGRTPYGMDRRAVERALTGKRVLITGAGGSIGSELCRIAATFRPEMLILMERAENALFEIDRQIGRRFPHVARRALLHDVVDGPQTLRHLMELRPHAIFHAAAHKHVPLMEDHPWHAVTNNLMGTKSIADAARAAGAERFVMISSDKAVNPTSVMGATKRLAEMYVQHLAGERNNPPPSPLPQGGGGQMNPPPTPSLGEGGLTRFSMVRFGNVLGSACSVLPIWSHQLAEGGPITVTDPRMTRYFMTINEAATLVIQAGALDTPSLLNMPGVTAQATPTVYVLDMGSPLRIADLAERFVRLHGLTPSTPAQGQRTCEAGEGQEGSADGTIAITYTGARPGEKLHEELSYAAEALLPTPCPGIMALASSAHAAFNTQAMLAEFSTFGPHTPGGQVVDAIRRHVPEMRAPAAVRVNNPLDSRTKAA